MDPIYYELFRQVSAKSSYDCVGSKNQHFKQTY